MTRPDFDESTVFKLANSCEIPLIKEALFQQGVILVLSTSLNIKTDYALLTASYYHPFPSLPWTAKEEWKRGNIIKIWRNLDILVVMHNQ